MTARISALAVLLLGCAATPPRASPPPDPMKPPVSRPADTTPADPLTLELAAQGYNVAFTTDGGEPSLVFTDGQLRGYALTGRSADAVALELRFGDSLERRPFLAEGPGVAVGVPVRIIALHARGEREWFSVIEAPPASNPSSAAPPWRVRLFERSGGRGKLLASHDSYAHLDSKQTRSLYEKNGEVVLLGFAGSLYAVARGSVLVLDGPGNDAARFMETEDPDCPPNKRCFLLPAEIDVKRFIGDTPGGRSFVMAGEGNIVRRDVATGATIGFGYHNFFYAGLVEEDAVVLAHAGEPPFVKRWSPAPPRPPSPPLPQVPGKRRPTPVAVATEDAQRQAPGKRRPAPVAPQTGDAQLLVEGPIYVQLARTTDGTVYGVTREGSLDRIADGRATPVVHLPPGHRVVAVAAADALAFVVASDTKPPVHAIVIPNRR